MRSTAKSLETTRSIVTKQASCASAKGFVLLHPIISVFSGCVLFFADTLCDHPCSCSGLSFNCAGANLTATWISERSVFSSNKPRRLRSLVLSLNNIILTPTLFRNFHWLGRLNLSHNLIDDVPDQSFVDLHNLFELDLRFNHMSSLRDNSLEGLQSLLKLDLRNNLLKTITQLQLVHLTSIKQLLITDNKIGVIGLNAFDSIPSLQVLSSDEYRFCCIAKQAQECTPEPDEFSSCEDLMANYTLQVRFSADISPRTSFRDECCMTLASIWPSSANW